MNIISASEVFLILEKIRDFFFFFQTFLLTIELLL